MLFAFKFEKTFEALKQLTLRMLFLMLVFFIKGRIVLTYVKKLSKQIWCYLNWKCYCDKIVVSVKVAFFRKYDAFFSLPKKCAKTIPQRLFGLKKKSFHYWRAPRGPRGVKKSHFFLQMKLFSFCAKIALKL